MKKFLFLMLLPLLSFGQQSFSLTPDGYAPQVFEVENKSANELFQKTKEWINTYYANPKEVLKAEIQDNMIRIEGFAKNGFIQKSLGITYSYDFSYILEIEFKDNKYRLNYTIGQLWADGKRCMYRYNSFFKKDGSIRSAYSESVPSMNDTINASSLSLYNYILGITKKNDGW